MSVYECEKMIEALKPIDIREFASLDWMRQNQSINQLNVQAHINAMMRGDEYVMESLASLDKVPIWLIPGQDAHL